MAYDEVKRPSEGVVGKGLRKRIVGERGARTFIHVESGGWPVHAPCPKQRVAKPGGANRRTEIILLLQNSVRVMVATTGLDLVLYMEPIARESVLVRFCIPITK